MVKGPCWLVGSTSSTEFPISVLYILVTTGLKSTVFALGRPVHRRRHLCRPVRRCDIIKTVHCTTTIEPLPVHIESSSTKESCYRQTGGESSCSRKLAATSWHFQSTTILPDIPKAFVAWVGTSWHQQSMERINFPTFSSKIGWAYPIHILHRVSYGWPKKPWKFRERLVKSFRYIRHFTVRAYRRDTIVSYTLKNKTSNWITAINEKHSDGLPEKQMLI